MMKYFILIICVALGRSAYAQTDYVVFFKGDTLRGEAKILSFDKIDRVQLVSHGKKTIYQATQIKSLKIENDFYNPVRIENSIRMMKKMKEGYLSLYSFVPEGQGGVWSGQYLLKKDGKGIEVPNLSFKKILSGFLNDCPDIKKGFDKGDFGKRDLDRIIDLYNLCIETKTHNTSQAQPAPKEIDNNKLLAVKELAEKINSETFSSKKDALDLVKDMEGKVSRNEPIPNYLGEGLKALLKDKPALASAADALLELLKK
ncbi:MAG: hypothetical protein JST69_07220 [Bacteroidetes bacterium]|nr:hypothetical protein [Bacteroidota bacterium]